jgi:hypothetical protein
MKILRPEEVKSFPEFRNYTPDEVAEAYVLARAAFTAEDLQRFTEVDDTIPFEEILAAIEEKQRKIDQGKP